MKVKSVRFVLFCLGALSVFSGKAMAQDEEIPPPANVQDVVDTVVTYDEDGNEIVSTETKTTSVAASTSGVTTAITGAANLHVSADATKVESKPEIELLTPMKRKDYDASNVHTKPCGGTKIGKVHYETTPGSRNMIGWKVKKADPNGTCVLRVADDPRDMTMEVLHMTDGSSDKDGRFPCGRNETPFEGKEFKLPKDLVCDTCILQLEWRTETDTQYRCVDFESVGTEIPECFGQCLNGGICRNGKCACPDTFEGSNCQFEKEIEDDDSNQPGVMSSLVDQGAILLVYVFMLLVIIMLLGGAYYFYEKMRKDQEQREREQQRLQAQLDKDAITHAHSGMPGQDSQFKDYD